LSRLPHDFGTVRFWRLFGTQAFAAVGAFSVVLGLLALLFPEAIKHSEGWYALGVVLVSLGYGLYRAWPTPITMTYNQPNVTVSIIQGDLFDQSGHIMIGMPDTFDTDIPEIIDPQSIQGQFLAKVFSNDVDEFDRRLDQALSGIPSTGSVTKEGKTERFPLGTVATLRERNRCYFCVAYTEMNARNQARGTPAGLWKSLDSLWRAVSEHGNGGQLSLPVIGGGQARISQVLPQQDSIRFIVLSFLLASRAEKICDELLIVVRPPDYRRLDRLELQAYLRSLRPS
jgi:Domain of unknown function (DUF6430)